MSKFTDHPFVDPKKHILILIFSFLIAAPVFLHEPDLLMIIFIVFLTVSSLVQYSVMLFKWPTMKNAFGFYGLEKQEHALLELEERNSYISIKYKKHIGATMFFLFALFFKILGGTYGMGFWAIIASWASMLSALLIPYPIAVLLSSLILWRKQNKT